jgi:hypothetical protein
VLGTGATRRLELGLAAAEVVRLYLMLHACVARFDVTGNLEKILVFRVN